MSPDEMIKTLTPGEKVMLAARLAQTALSQYPVGRRKPESFKEAADITWVIFSEMLKRQESGLPQNELHAMDEGMKPQRPLSKFATDK